MQNYKQISMFRTSESSKVRVQNKNTSSSLKEINLEQYNKIYIKSREVSIENGRPQCQRIDLSTSGIT